MFVTHAFRPRRLLVVLLALLVISVLLLALTGAPATRAQSEEDDYAAPFVTLLGRAVLPADTFAPGPPSGAAVRPNNGRTPPFPSQPVQGVSAVIPKWNGNFLVMADNGFGAKTNSADFRLRWYEMAIDFNSGQVAVVGYTELSDPNNLVPWPIVNGATDRVLTGADFDLESFQQAPDGTFWFGEEFGPYILHTDAAGRLLQAPISMPYPAELEPFARGLPYVQSPEHPQFADLPDRDSRIAAANLPSSRGLEGMAINEDGDILYPLMEGALQDDPIQTRLMIQEFDLETGTFTGNYWYYLLEDPTYAIGEMTVVEGNNEFLIIERDQGQGAEARFKRIYRVNLNSFDQNRVLRKQLVVDLMSITDEREITAPEEGAIGLGNFFSFPFITIESVYPFSDGSMLVANDNNYPGSNGRRPGVPDDNEFILIKPKN
ncbi:MAG: esterase-like activity of phytase family protein [Chloroflexaceae bacterium]|nr:esterase-like activity of phytase family protein [Chloroflexaceae bacterium]NJO05068.1 esterase-like activity of phytase family protein [Chloroflexaceae bacterium]NJO84665.1 esterase-like activity of phytase family protein [Blastochloris sp.]